MNKIIIIICLLILSYYAGRSYYLVTDNIQCYIIYKLMYVVVFGCTFLYMRCNIIKIDKVPNISSFRLICIGFFLIWLLYTGFKNFFPINLIEEVGSSTNNPMLFYNDDDWHYADLFKAVVLTPLAEEFLYRGVIFCSTLYLFGLFLTTRKSTYIALLISGLIFGYDHLEHGFLYFFITTLGGFVFAYVYFRSGKIIVPIVIHMLINFTASRGSIEWLVKNHSDSDVILEIAKIVTRLPVLVVFLCGVAFTSMELFRELRKYHFEALG